MRVALPQTADRLLAIRRERDVRDRIREFLDLLEHLLLFKVEQAQGAVEVLIFAALGDDFAGLVVLVVATAGQGVAAVAGQGETVDALIVLLEAADLASIGGIP